MCLFAVVVCLFFYFVLLLFTITYNAVTFLTFFLVFCIFGLSVHEYLNADFNGTVQNECKL